MQRGGNDQHKEELPSDLVERDRARHKENDVGEIQAGHADAHTLTANMGWEDFGAGRGGTDVSFGAGCGTRT